MSSAEESTAVVAQWRPVIVHYGDLELTHRLVTSLAGVRPAVVANDLRPDPKWPGLDYEWLVPERNLGYGEAFNFAVRSLPEAPVYGLLNTDIVIDEAAVRRCLDVLADRPDLGVVAPLLLRPDGSVQHGPGRLSRGLHLPKQLDPPMTGVVECTWVTGAVMFIRGDTARRVPMDGSFFLGFEDVEFCVRLREAGHGTALVAEAEVEHVGGTTINAWWYYYAVRNQVWFVRAHSGLLRAALAWILLVVATPRILLADLVKRRGLARTRWTLAGLRDCWRPKPHRVSGPWPDEPRPLARARENPASNDPARDNPARDNPAGDDSARADRPLRVACPVGLFEPGFRGGGLVRSVARLVDTAPPSFAIDVITQDRDLGAEEPYPDLSGRTIARGDHRVTYLSSDRRAMPMRAVRAVRATRPDVVYFNSLFDPVFTLAVLVALRLPLIRSGVVLMAPRGQLSPGALTLKTGRKQLALRALRLLLRGRDTWWHASTPLEAAEIVQHFPAAKGRVLVVEDQTSLAEEARTPTAIEGPGVRAIFLSRVSAKKNLLTAIQALASLPEVSLDVWGPLEDAAYWQQCRDAIEELGLGERVRHRGEVEPAQVVDTFARYDVFLLPTLGENFGHVIVESLAASCPVVCSDRTPFTDLLAEGGGWAGPPTSDFVARCLAEFVALSADERLERRRGAGAAYERWRRASTDLNILVALREAAMDATAPGESALGDTAADDSVPPA